MRVTRCGRCGVAYGRGSGLGRKFINEYFNVDHRLFVAVFGLCFVDKLCQGCLGWPRVGYNCHSRMVVQSMRIGWLVAAQGCAGKGCDFLCGHAEYR